MINGHKNAINGINKTEIKSFNILTLDHIVSKVVIKNYLLKNPESKFFVKSYFYCVKNTLLHYSNDGEHKQYIIVIDEIKKNNNEELNNRLNYIQVMKFNNAIEDIIKTKLFNLKSKSLKKSIDLKFANVSFLVNMKFVNL